MVDPALVIQLINIRVTPIDAEYKASKRCTCEVPLSPFGIWTNIFLFAVAWKTHLSAAVSIGMGSISIMLMNLGWSPDMCWLAPEL